MRYAVLIKDKKDATIYRFLNVKQEIVEENPKEIIDPETQEVRTEVELVPTGKFETVKYTTENREEFEAKCIELLNTYNRSEILPISLEDYDVDLLWKSE